MTRRELEAPDLPDLNLPDSNGVILFWGLFVPSLALGAMLFNVVTGSVWLPDTHRMGLNVTAVPLTGAPWPLWGFVVAKAGVAAGLFARYVLGNDRRWWRVAQPIEVVSAVVVGVGLIAGGVTYAMMFVTNR